MKFPINRLSLAQAGDAVRANYHRVSRADNRSGDLDPAVGRVVSGQGDRQVTVQIDEDKSMVGYTSRFQSEGDTCLFHVDAGRTDAGPVRGFDLRKSNVFGTIRGWTYGETKDAAGNRIVSAMEMFPAEAASTFNFYNGLLG